MTCRQLVASLLITLHVCKAIKMSRMHTYQFSETITLRHKLLLTKNDSEIIILNNYEFHT